MSIEYIPGILIEHETLGIGKITEVSKDTITVWFLFHSPGIIFGKDTSRIKPIHIPFMFQQDILDYIKSRNIFAENPDANGSILFDIGITERKPGNRQL